MHPVPWSPTAVLSTGIYVPRASVPIPTVISTHSICTTTPGQYHSGRGRGRAGGQGQAHGTGPGYRGRGLGTGQGTGAGSIGHGDLGPGHGTGAGTASDARCGHGGRIGWNHIRARALGRDRASQDRKSTRLNSSHVKISYAVFCLKKKKTNKRVGHRRHVHNVD